MRPVIILCCILFTSSSDADEVKLPTWTAIHTITPKLLTEVTTDIEFKVTKRDIQSNVGVRFSYNIWDDSTSWALNAKTDIKYQSYMLNNNMVRTGEAGIELVRHYSTNTMYKIEITHSIAPYRKYPLTNIEHGYIIGIHAKYEF